MRRPPAALAGILDVHQVLWKFFEVRAGESAAWMCVTHSSGLPPLSSTVTPMGAGARGRSSTESRNAAS